MMRGSHAEKVRKDCHAEPKKLEFFSLNWGVYSKNRWCWTDLVTWWTDGGNFSH